MELPDDVLMYIREFTRPVSRPDWKKGGALNRANVGDTFTHWIEFSFFQMVDTDLLEEYGYDDEDIIVRWWDMIPDGDL